MTNSRIMFDPDPELAMKIAPWLARTVVPLWGPPRLEGKLKAPPWLNTEAGMAYRWYWCWFPSNNGRLSNHNISVDQTRGNWTLHVGSHCHRRDSTVTRSLDDPFELVDVARTVSDAWPCIAQASPACVRINSPTTTTEEHL